MKDFKIQYLLDLKLFSSSFFEHSSFYSASPPMCTAARPCSSSRVQRCWQLKTSIKKRTQLKFFLKKLIFNHLSQITLNYCYKKKVRYIFTLFLSVFVSILYNSYYFKYIFVTYINHCNFLTYLRFLT